MFHINGADFTGCWQSIIFTALAIVFHSGGLWMCTPSCRHICGPLHLKSTPFFPSACRPGDLRCWGGFNYAHVFSVPTMHCSRQRLDTYIVVFTLPGSSLSFSGAMVMWDVLPREILVGWGQKTSVASDDPLRLRCCGGGWIQFLTVCIASYLVSQMSEPLARRL